jgi:hypothetical protein
MYIPLTFEGALQKCLFASGGYEGYFISGSQQWKYHWFTGSANLEVQKGTIDNVQIYVIGAGGGGAITPSIATGYAAGGGGGGVNYVMNARLFKGTYSAGIGDGGTPGTGSFYDGFSGSASTFIGSNIYMVANGGGGGRQGLNNRGGTSGNGILGGRNLTNTNLNGGGGGGSLATGNDSALGKAGNGGSGVTIYVAGQGFDFGCGGGGYSPSTTQGYSCSGTVWGEGGQQNNSANSGAPSYGMGGGGNIYGNYNKGWGATGSVIIQYPIYDYCTNYFNKSGSCGCRELTLSTDYYNSPGDYQFTLTGSYMYQPCGTNKFVSGSLSAYHNLTVCAVSNSYFSYTATNTGPNPDTVTTISGLVNDTFLSGAAQCISKSVGTVPCTTETFIATCSSSVVTIYTPTASASQPNSFYYVAKNETTHSVYTTTTPKVKYICVSTGSIYGNGVQQYPQFLSSSYVAVAGTEGYIYPTASCYTITITNGTNRRSTVALCNGSVVDLINPTVGSTYCIDGTVGVQPIYLYNPIIYSVGGDCLSGSFNTGSCGCP